MKNILFCSQQHEIALIQKIYYEMKLSPKGYFDENALFLQVSPDFSGVVSTILSHQFTHNGYVPSTESIQVPYPGESPDKYIERFIKDFQTFLDFNGLNYNTKYILTEGGILSGRNYTWITDVMINEYKIPSINIITTTVYENIHSQYKCDFVGEYFDYTTEDLVFWWEKPDRMFGDLSWTIDKK
jgi:hypothetical protein